MQKFKASVQSVPKIEWKQMDRWMEAIALPPLLMWSVKVAVVILHSAVQTLNTVDNRYTTGWLAHLLLSGRNTQVGPKSYVFSIRY